MTIIPGTTLGPYRIDAPIGEGGMGAVWKARDTRLDRTVAIKVSKEQFNERFEREARSVAALNHPNICQLYDVGPDYLVMEYIEGAPLKGPLPVEKAVEYAGQILDALAAAHKKGITHRDLKPANILVTKQGIKLLDFGLAKQTAPLKETDETRTASPDATAKGTILGTLQFMSPEQLQGKEADSRSDLFAFGCVLHEMLTGRRAFSGDSAASVIAAILEREPEPMGVNPPLDRVVRKCLAKDADDRFQSARDLKYNLRLAMEPVAAAPVVNRRPWILAAAAALVLGVVGGLAVARYRTPPVTGQVIRFQIYPPPGGQFSTGDFAVSPDSRSLAYVVNLEGKSSLWVRQVDGTAARAIPLSENARLPFWSPDSRSIAYFASGKIWRVDLAGGAPVAVSDTIAYILPRGGAWTDEGKIIFASSGQLLQVSANGGRPEVLVTASPGAALRWPKGISGRTVLYELASGASRGIHVIDLAKPQEDKSVLPIDGSAVYSGGVLLFRRGLGLVAQSFDSLAFAVFRRTAGSW